MQKTLYSLVDDLKFLEDIEPESEEQEVRVQETIKLTKLGIQEKASNIGKYLLSLQAEEEVYKQEEARLKARRQAIHNRYEWLKQYLFHEMRTALILKIKGDVCTMSIQQSPPSVEITNLDIIPPEFIKTIIEPKKKEILDHFKETGCIPAGTNIITNKLHLVIR